MKKVNNHDLKMNGLKKAAGATHHNDGARFITYLQISYNMDNGNIYSNEHADNNSWSQYHDDNIITVAKNIKKPLTMQQIADLINEAVCYHKNR